MTGNPTGGPGALIIGAARSGTTALAAALAQHDDVVFSSPKEPHFLAHGHSDVHFAGPGDDEMMNRPRVRSADDYRALFDGASAQRLAIEGSVSTLYAGADVLPAIAEHCRDDVKLIAMLRRPSARSFSSYQYLRARGHEDCDDFGRALDLESARTAANFHHMWRYRDVSRYEQQLPAFVDAFGDRLHIVIFEEYRANTDQALAGILAYLDLDPTVAIDTTTEVNSGGEPKSELFGAALTALRRSDLVTSATKRFTSRALRERIRAANLDKVAIAPDTHEQLVAEFAPTRAYVEQLLGRPIDAWRND